MFYNNLVEECKRKSLKVTPIVTECGGASGSISAWKKGAMPNSDIVLKLAMRLNVSCDYLLTGKSSSATTAKSLTEDEQELLECYRKLDKRGHHRLLTSAYEELDRMNGVEVPPRPIPFAASGEADITPENYADIQARLQKYDKRAKELEGK